jgi:hypothetical protein
MSRSALYIAGGVAIVVVLVLLLNPTGRSPVTQTKEIAKPSAPGGRDVTDASSSKASQLGLTAEELIKGTPAENILKGDVMSTLGSIATGGATDIWRKFSSFNPF